MLAGDANQLVSGPDRTPCCFARSNRGNPMDSVRPEPHGRRDVIGGNGDPRRLAAALLDAADEIERPE
jgi:hypothetical protein